MQYRIINWSDFGRTMGVRFLSLFFAFGLSIVPASALAGLSTDSTSARITPGPATLTGTPQINVTAYYAGDDNLNNRIDIEWGLDGIDFSLGSQSSPTHPAPPYVYTITPLDNNQVYQIRVTFTDPDNGSAVSKQYTGQKPYNPLIHNAISTGSGTSKWGSGWGTSDGQYGEFRCQTCHDRNSGNIKRVRKDWSLASLPDVPVKTHLDDQNVDFQTNQVGMAQYALDDASDHATSNRICESCHTMTAHHRHDESTTPGTLDHYSDKDCLACHEHGSGFAAPSCSSCHGGGTTGTTASSYWPDSVVQTVDQAGSSNDAGEHQIHMAILAARVYGYSLNQLLDSANSGNEQTALCSRCHENPGADADHGSGDDAEVTRFLAIDGSTDGGTAGAFSAATATCSSVDCHNGRDLPADNSWYAGSNPTGSDYCLLCHTPDNSNSEAFIDPLSGLHYQATPNGVILHNNNFGSGGGCLSCHAIDPSDRHFNGVAESTAAAAYNFQSSGIDVKLNDLADATDDTCAANCHADSGTWYRLWSSDAFDTTPVDITQPLPVRCNVCHGVFQNWADGSSHARTYQGTGSIVGNSHNSQNPNDNPGAACEDCHNYPSDVSRHENGQLTVNDDVGSVVDPVVIPQGIYCAPCHAAPVVAADFPPELTSEVIPLSVFPLERVDNGSQYPIESCFSGAMGCHGDKQQRWWPAGKWPTDQVDPAYRTDGTTNFGYPNRAGAHPEHNLTLGILVAETRTGIPGTIPTDQDFNSTCRFCHPMEQNGYGTWVVPDGKHRDGITDMYGGYRFDGANEKGLVLSGDPVTGNWSNYNNYPNATDGYLYQLDDPENPGSRYPLDRDVVYRQYLYEYRGDAAVNHGTCSQVACHSNSPFTPQWFGDDQPPGAVTGLSASTDDLRATHVVGETDAPGTVLLTWTAPGDNGDLSGTAYEYEVFYSDSGPITEANVGSATRAGKAPTVYRKGEAQEMVVDGLRPGASYWFAVRTKDQPRYDDTDGDGIHETFVADGNRSPLTAIGPVVAHGDDVHPRYWGVGKAVSHDSGGAINLTWEAAKDNTLPIIYLVYWSDYSLKAHLARGGSMPVLTKPAQYDGGVYSFGYTDNGPGVAPTPGGADYTISVGTTTGLHYQVSGLGSGILYNFLVRAEDGYDPVGDGTGIGNIDDNRVVVMALPSKLPQEHEATMMGILSGASGMVMQADPLNPDWGSVSTGTASLVGTDSVTFTATSDLDGAASREIWVQGISIDLHVENTDRKLPQSFDVQFGYVNGAFTPIGSTVSVGLGRRSNRVMKIGLSANSGIVPADTVLAIRFTRTTSSGSISAIDLNWGDATNKGQILLMAQPINHPPSAPTVNPLVRSKGGYINVTWSQSNDGTPADGGQTLHYDVFGSSDNGATWAYIIGTGLTDADAAGGVIWDTVGDGLDRFNAGNYNILVKVEASDGYLFETVPGGGVWNSHTTAISAPLALDNSQDDENPAAPTINHMEPRPKEGSTYLHWIAVGNDGYNHGTRAAYYDIRFRKVIDGPLTGSWDALQSRITGGTWLDASTVQAEGEPVPGFSGFAETYELLNMTPDIDYQVAMQACDSGEDDLAGTPDDNCSPLSNVYTITSGQYYCGICHSTPPDEPDTGGVHRQHGYTLEDCAKCHGDGTSADGNNVMTYDGRHYDGVINIGWAENSDGSRATLVELAAQSGGSGVTLTQNNGSAVTIYQDPDGAGGYNAGTAYNPGAPLENTDSGKCMNFGAANASGCHGPFQPKWASDTVEVRVAPTCADCHGDKSMAVNDDAGTEFGRLTDPYGRQWDQADTSQALIGGVYPPQEELLASPPVDNHNLGGKATRYTGAHLRHLNASFRFAEGDSCRLCHRDTMESGKHADRNVDVVFDFNANQSESVLAQVTEPADVDTLGVSCSSLNNLYCHDTTARWAEPGAKCNDCHGMTGLVYDPVADSTTIGHVMGAMGDVVDCTYCHVPGHPQSPDGITPGDPDTLLINNNPAIGINYRSGGIHLKKAYPWGTFDTLAEICWGCHDQNNDGDLNDAGDINEFNTNNRAATGNSPYNYGTLDQRSWVGAIWSSGYGQTSGDPFYYKRGKIQSTHSADPSGTSRVVWNSVRGRYDETLDSVSAIRCSNCHDVHNLNLAPNDTMSGIPYLRGTWMGNPYEEDGAPYNRSYAAATVIGAVPRGGTAYDQLGGFYIDQNNVVPGSGNSTMTESRYPTSGWTVQSSAGLCVLCHGDDVDEMDQRKPATDAAEANLWLGSNGHSNSALGGTFSASANIFDYAHGRPTPVSYDWGGGRPKDQNHFPVQVPDMAYIDQGNVGLAGGGYRGQDTNSGRYNPMVTLAQPYAFNAYDWGATVDGSTTDQMYHQFSCSKCHNPHASRLPKLMITNCLDIRHNTWDDAQTAPFLQNTFTAATLTTVDRGMPASYYASAQNCHRFDDRRSDTTLRGGWNKVTPWAFDNDEIESEHKGSYTPAYSTRSGN